MKKLGCLNSNISKVLADMGHTECMAIGDCGLPIPQKVQKIDLALKMGVPSFIEVLEEVMKDMKIEKVILAEEIKVQNPKMLEKIKVLFQNHETAFKIEYITHDELKEESKKCKAIIRTGEATPYANIILQAACIFS